MINLVISGGFSFFQNTIESIVTLMANHRALFINTLFKYNNVEVERFLRM